jgi:thiol:disulfide interchange protein
MAARCAECLNEAIERCEVSGAPLCAGCLWYTEDGRRVSERVARRMREQGMIVHSPDTYLEQLGAAIELPRLPEAPPLPSRPRNGNDFVAALAGIGGIISIATCFGVGFALCAPPLPLLPLLLGGIGLAGAQHASNPDQARLLSWLGIAGGLGFIALMLLLVIGSIAFGTTSLLGALLAPSGAPAAP